MKNIKVQERNRITCVLNLYHEQAGDQPQGTRLGFSETLQHSSQPYMRRMHIGEEPQPLDLGWFEPDQVGSVLIENLEGSRLLVNPSDEEMERINSRIVDLTVAGTLGFTIAPRRFFLFFPVVIDNLLLRCRSEKAKCRVTIYGA